MIELEKFSYLSRPNLEYIEGLYQSFRNSPDSIDPEWRMFFQGVEFAQNLGGKLGAQAGLSSKELDVFRLVNAYRDYGHFEANLNPLAGGTKSFPELSLFHFNLSEADLDTRFEIGALIGKPGATLREIVAHLRSCYCRTISVQVAEAMPTVRNWFIDEFEKKGETFTLSSEEKKQIFLQLAKTESFEKFLGTRYVGKKRFSIEGTDALIPILERLTAKGATSSVEELVVGMAHRGRLNVLVNFMEKAVDRIFAEFEGVRDEFNSTFDGDVKYHLGYSADKKVGDSSVHLSLAYNPSHLEAVDPVVLGMTRAKQRRRKDTSERKKVIAVLIHGDAAFAGQGVVAETLQLSQLKGYTVGGTIHIVTDNQVGFTTNPESTRSSPYSSDISKILQTPVIHVNADDVEACVRATDIALRFRQEFKRDVVINMIGYRRFGHNEGDEPAFTQPVMYEKIKKHPTLYDIYAQKLVKEGVINDEEPEKLFKERIEFLQGHLDSVKKTPPQMKPLVFEGLWKGLRRSTHEDFQKPTNTKTTLKVLQETAKILFALPQGFSPHPKITKLLKDRAAMMDGEGNVDWGMGELLAYGSILFEGNPVRISGQDVIRGTFTHRHAGYFDIKTNEGYLPLSTIKPEEVEFVVYNSPLSEYAVLGFEYGNSSTDPTFLVVWEAQFGDFANGAQIIIDQFIASAEQKWQRMSGIVLLLPHGYEGQGPEHSSARLERFLQLCGQDNMQVVNLTTPAQLFHALRRQVKRDFRKPLVVMSPKSLLRHPKVHSTLKDLYDGSFQEVLSDTTANTKAVETLVLCSGKVYYNIMDGKEKADAKVSEKVAITRVEQLYPFPDHKLIPELKRYPNLKRILWTQEEPKNMGAWLYIYPRLQEMAAEAGVSVDVVYNGRTERASPATGSDKVHFIEQDEIVNRCFAAGPIGGVKSPTKAKSK
jgi:2-oxoglutarate dehydrogenase E1 component